MNAPNPRRRSSLRAPGDGAPPPALWCARNIHAAVDRRAPEAAALAEWLAENAAAFGIPENAIPEDDGPGRSRRRGVPASDWHKIGTALATPAASWAEGEAADLWITAIGRRLALDALERQILELALHYRLDRRGERLWDALSECRGRPTRFMRDTDLIALLLAAPRPSVAARLAGGAKLLVSGALRLGSRADLSPLERLVSLIRRDVPPVADIYDQLVGASGTEPLEWEAFAHLGREAELAAEALRAAVARREAGVNILLYGPPGTGKTSFAATLAARIAARLRPVAESDDDGDEPDRDQRLAGLRLAQQLAAPGTTVLLFDEAEDLFSGRRVLSEEPQSSSRVFMHRLLERTAVPVIWTANDIGVLGPAVLRRMTMCLELRVPNLATRTVLWRRLGEAHGVALNDADAARLARLVPAPPAIAETALRAARLAGGGAETARLIVEGVARAVRGGDLSAPEPELDANYDPALVNADSDLAALEAALVRPAAPRAVSFLIAGPPGVGKSAWIRHLAGRMGLPVLQKRASDLLDPFVGGTEHKIADAFAEARDTGAFLVFDDADSLLLERADAVHSWEISEVNEMLTWMESHSLPFACTTNLAERMDRASLRRFLVKLRFDWLTGAQARLAFRRFFAMVPPDALDALRTLTPADFALVRRRAALHTNSADVAVLLRLLAAECTGRGGPRQPIGFAADRGK
jgi:SpoVK/Ycf46/Vps4 family AAA+-type ATPase